MRIAITASRGNYREQVENHFEEWFREFRVDYELPLSELTIGHGACKNSGDVYVEEYLGEEYCDDDIIIKRFPVDLKIDDPWPGAGPSRNKRMLQELKPEILLAFWNGHSKGTEGCIKLAVKMGIKVNIFPLTGKN